ncbi:MAG: Crp/Fnr family transcriptional regulator [Chitinophagaceae bacterium]|jgi:CRP-like cAMP-binding protein|nr:Crp/Fnr family transcriptional regulator [Chitinophagaceae bacterium]
MQQNSASDKQLELLHTFVQRIHPMGDDAWNAFAGIWHTVKVKRKTGLLSPGQTERHVYFVLEGVQRAYFMDDDGRETTIVFTYPTSFSGVADSFLTQTPSIYFFETLTPSLFLRSDYPSFQEITDRYPSVERMIRQATAFALKGALERQVELSAFSAERKFTTLLRRSPHLLQLIPQKYLASYAGIDEATFSKLMKKIRL